MNLKEALKILNKEGFSVTTSKESEDSLIHDSLKGNQCIKFRSNISGKYNDNLSYFVTKKQPFKHLHDAIKLCNN